MIPFIAAATAVTSLAGGLLKLGQPSNQHREMTGAADFRRHLADQVREQERNQAAQFHSIESLLAMQQSMGALPPNMQLTLAKQLVGRTVQARDAAGNTFTGIVTGIRFANDQAQVIIGKRNCPLSSVQAVLRGLDSPASLKAPFASPLGMAPMNLQHS
ncbi:MAG: hypothetical protein HY360_01710 [Verrucomicrobia bacterium]|nr:hypothetical protein [Verrucomicrobiota bacterium]